MPDLGIGEALAGIFGSGGLDALFGIGSAEAAAAPAEVAGVETGLATVGLGADGVAAGTSAGLADIVGTGTGLASGATGLEGTLLAGGAGGSIDAALGVGGATAAGTAADFLSAPAASGFNTAAVTPGAAGFSTDSAIASLTGSPTTGAGTTAINPAAPNSVFDTGSNPLTGVGSNGSPAAASAASVSAPSGVAPAAGIDPTAAAGTVPNAVGPTSLNGAPVSGGPPGSTSISDLLGKAGTGITDSLTKNPLGIGLGAAGLGYNILEGQKNTKNQQALTADAATATANSNQMVASGEALQQYLTNGTLPPAYQTQVDQAIANAKTAAISNAAAQGLPTDPTKNTALATELASIDNQRGAMQTQVASQLFSSGQGLVNSGATAAGLSGQLYSALVQNDTTQAANTGKAIATLAAALNGKSSNSAGNVTISTG